MDPLLNHRLGKLKSAVVHEALPILSSLPFMLDVAKEIVDITIAPPIVWAYYIYDQLTPIVSHPLFWFLLIFTFRYLRLIIHCIAFYLYTPTQIPTNPTLTPQDCTVIIPTVDPSNVEFSESLQSCLLNRPREIFIVTVGLQNRSVCQQVIQPYITTCPATTITILVSQKANKRTQVALAIAQVKTKISVLMDDHVIWGRNFLPTALAPFEDPKTGAVGTNKRVRKEHLGFNILSYWNMLGALYLERHNFEIRATNTIDGGVFVISGRTSLHRTEILQHEDFLPGFTNERFFFGMLGPLNADDDNYITRFEVSHGWKIKIQYSDDACIETTLGAYPKFVQQCLRWVRTTWRSNSASLFTDRTVWRRQPWCVYAVYVTSFFNFALFNDVGLAYLLWHSGYGTPGWLAVLGTWIFATKMVKLWPYFERHPEDLRMLPGYFAFAYFHSLIKAYAGLTFWNCHWGGRDLDAITKAAGGSGVKAGATKSPAKKTSSATAGVRSGSLPAAEPMNTTGEGHFNPVARPATQSSSIPIPGSPPTPTPAQRSNAAIVSAPAPAVGVPNRTARPAEVTPQGDRSKDVPSTPPAPTAPRFTTTPPGNSSTPATNTSPTTPSTNVPPASPPNPSTTNVPPPTPPTTTTPLPPRTATPRDPAYQPRVSLRNPNTPRQISLRSNIFDESTEVDRQSKGPRIKHFQGGITEFDEPRDVEKYCLHCPAVLKDAVPASTIPSGTSQQGENNTSAPSSAPNTATVPKRTSNPASNATNPTSPSNSASSSSSSSSPSSPPSPTATSSASPSSKKQIKTSPCLPCFTTRLNTALLILFLLSTCITHYLIAQYSCLPPTSRTFKDIVFNPAASGGNDSSSISGFPFPTDWARSIPSTHLGFGNKGSSFGLGAWGLRGLWEKSGAGEVWERWSERFEERIEGMRGEVVDRMDKGGWELGWVRRWIG